MGGGTHVVSRLATTDWKRSRPGSQDLIRRRSVPPLLQTVVTERIRLDHDTECRCDDRCACPPQPDKQHLTVGETPVMVVMRRSHHPRGTHQVAARQPAGPAAGSRDIDFRMSSEQRRRRGVRAVAGVGVDGVFAFPVARVSTQGPLLLVLHADIEHLAEAIDAVLSVDPQAEAIRSRVLFADPTSTAGCLGV